MNERALTVFEQYELDITETFKIRGNYGCNTPDGKYILQEYDNSNDKMVSMKSLYNHLESSGIKTDYVIPNKEDRYVSVSEDGYTYILKKWFESQILEGFILCAKTAKDLWRRLKVFIPAKICL